MPRRSLLDIIPPGITLAFAGKSIPTGWLLCDGRFYERTTHPELFEAIGNTYGSSGSRFKVPDLRNQFIRGMGESGRSLGSTQDDSFITHTHLAESVGVDDHFHTLNIDNTFFNIQQPTRIFNHDIGPPGHRNHRTILFVDFVQGETNQEGDHVHDVVVSNNKNSFEAEELETRPRNMALYFIIKF